jgi:folate-dependent phosphoribosylglycinamide formyltransferase PurN
MLKVGVLGSTRGTALQGVLDAVAAGTLPVEVAIVISDKPAAPLLERATRHGVHAVLLDPQGSSRAEFDRRVSALLESAQVQLVLLIGYMRIVSGEFVEDAGRIVLQKRCAVMPGDTVETLKGRVQALEQAAFVEVLQGWRG